MCASDDDTKALDFCLHSTCFVEMESAIVEYVALPCRGAQLGGYVSEIGRHRA
jgi:hypothetical protein